MAVRQPHPNRGRAESSDLLTRRLRGLYLVDGCSTYEIARVVTLDRQEVTRRLRGAGVDVAPRGAVRPRPSTRTLTKASSCAIRRLYLEGHTLAEIGTAFGISSRTVRRLLRRQGVRIRTRGWANREDRITPPLEAETLYLDRTLPAGEVGRQLGCSRASVLRMAHDLGWPVRVGGPAPRRGPEEIELIDALYEDRLVSGALSRCGVPRVAAGGPIWQRFPAPCDADPALLRHLYVHCGLAANTSNF